MLHIFIVSFIITLKIRFSILAEISDSTNSIDYNNHHQKCDDKKLQF